MTRRKKITVRTTTRTPYGPAGTEVTDPKQAEHFLKNGVYVDAGAGAGDGEAEPVPYQELGGAEGGVDDGAEGGGADPGEG